MDLFFDMKSWQLVSLPAWLKGLNVEMILISGFMNLEIRMTSNFFSAELILISEITNSEVRIPSTFRYFYQADRLPGFLSGEPLLILVYISSIRQNCIHFVTIKNLPLGIEETMVAVVQEMQLFCLVWCTTKNLN